MFSFYRYFRISELQRQLRARDLAAPDARVRFVLPSRANEEYLLDSLRTEGRYFGSKPAVWSWSELYRAFVPKNELRRQVDPPDHRMILTHILDETLAELDRQGTGVPDGVRRRGFVDLLSAAIRELLLEDVRPDCLIGTQDTGAVSGSGAILPDELLYRLYTDYLIYLETHGLADNSQLPSLTRIALEEAGGGQKALPPGTTLCWIGFLSFTGAQLKLIRQMRALQIDMLFFSPDSGMSTFYDAASQLGARTERQRAGAGLIATLTAENAYEQYDAVARVVAEMRASRGALYEALCAAHPEAAAAPGEIGIYVVPERMALMQSALRSREVPFQSRAETAVSDTRLLEFVRRVWEASGLGWPTRRTMHLLTDPLLGLGRLEEEYVFSVLPEGEDGWHDFLRDTRKEQAAQEFSRICAFCAALRRPQGHTAEDLLRLLHAFVEEAWIARFAEEASDDGALDAAVRLLASARMEIEQKLEQLAELAPSIGPAGGKRFYGRDCLGFFVEWAKESTTALQPMQSGVVTLYDAPPPVLVSHALWVMTDADPVRFSTSVSDQALLSGQMREAINELEAEGVHLPTLREKREQKEAIFRRLLAVGSTLTLLTRAAVDAQGRAQGESPFLAPALLSGDWTKIYETDAPTTTECGVNRTRLYRGRFPRTAVLAPAAAGAAEKKRVFASSVDDWRACPFLYWCLYIARLQPPRDEYGTMGRLAQGRMLHTLWEAVWRLYMNPGEARVSLSALLHAHWAQLIEELAKDLPALSDVRTKPLVSDLYTRMLAIAHLQDAVEARAAQQGDVRLGADMEFALPAYELDHVVFAGVPDRVDLWRDAGAVVVDYKLGKSDAYRDSLQLAVYAAIMRENGMRLGGYCYIGHRDGRLRGAWSEPAQLLYQEPGRNPASLEEKMEEALALMAEIDAAVATGDFAANYDAHKCKMCAFAGLCRRTERLGSYSPEEEGAEDLGDA